MLLLLQNSQYLDFTDFSGICYYWLVHRLYGTLAVSFSLCEFFA